MTRESAARAFREFHAQRDERRRREREAHRLGWLERVRAAVRELAPREPAIRTVHLFGSLIQPGRFSESSDIDLAVDCNDPAAESRFWRAMEERLGREVDVRPRTGGVAWAVDAYGELCYAREIPAAGPQHPERAGDDR